MEKREESFKANEKDAVLLFDGVCNTCNFFVDFILKRDKNRRIGFVPLQTEIGDKLLKRYKLTPGKLDTLVFIHQNRAYTHSEAVFRVFSLLGWAWKIFCIFSILPLSVTDFFYRCYAKNRYLLFGKKETCRILTKQEGVFYFGDK